MKKMIQGAVLTGLGVALVIGGGGTLAVWHDEKPVAAGTIPAGEVDVVSGEGTWIVASTETEVDFTSYLVAPGDSLASTQSMMATLDGDPVTAVAT